MHYPRSNFPSHQASRHITMGLSVLARHMQHHPHLFKVQMDHSAVLPYTTVAKLRDDFAASLHLGGMRDPAQHSFFHEEERHTITTALLALNEYRDHLGDEMVSMEMAHLLKEESPMLAHSAEIDSLAAKTLEKALLPSLSDASPHRGESYEHRLLNEPPIAAGADANNDKRFRIVEEMNDGTDVTLESFDTLPEAEEALCLACQEGLDAYLVDREDLAPGPTSPSYARPDTTLER